MTVSNRALIMLSDLLRHHRSVVGTRWRKLEPGQHALLVLAHLRKGDTYAELAAGFAVGTTTVYRYLHEAIELLAARAPTLEQAIEVARGKAFVTLDGTLLRIDRVGMTGGRDRPYYSGKHKCHGMNVQVLADPAGRLIWASPRYPVPATTWAQLVTTASPKPWPPLLSPRSPIPPTEAPDLPCRYRNDVDGAIPTPAATARYRQPRSRSTLRTPVSVARVSGPTPS
jgi:hypothetical protein